MHAHRADVMGEDAADIVFLHLAEIGRARAEGRDADRRVSGRTARNHRRRTHRAIDRFRPLLVDQHHRALGHRMGGEKVLLGAGDDVDNGVADAKNVVTDVWHANLF